LAQLLEGLASAWQWRGGSLVGPYTNCDHKVGKETGVGGIHRVSDEADMGRWWLVDLGC
jgi:hypothetical protein